MAKTIQTRIYYYRFDISDPQDKASYDSLMCALKTIPFPVWEMRADFAGPSSDLRSFMAKVREAAGRDGGRLTLETDFLFRDQWNATDPDLRVFNRAEVVYKNPDIKEGYWLEQTPEMVAILRDTLKCGFCGKLEPAASGRTFCDKCLGSEYLKPDDFPLLRLLPVCEEDKKRKPLSAAERAELLPQYADAQRTRLEAKEVMLRADVEADYKKALAEAKIKREAKLWILDNAPEFFDNYIYYPHTDKHCFGWRKPLTDGEVAALLDVISEFPFAYTIKRVTGQPLEGY